MGPIALYARLGTQAETPNMIKIWKTKDTAKVPTLALDE